MAFDLTERQVAFCLFHLSPRHVKSCTLSWRSQPNKGKDPLQISSILDFRIQIEQGLPICRSGSSASHVSLLLPSVFCPKPERPCLAIHNLFIFFPPLYPSLSPVTDSAKGYIKGRGKRNICFHSFVCPTRLNGFLQEASANPAPWVGYLGPRPRAVPWVESHETQPRLQSQEPAHQQRHQSSKP